MSEEYRPRCMNFSCKSMMVFGEDFQNDPEYQGGLSDVWCLCTFKDVGPDGDGVTLDMCSDQKRSCFKEY